MIYIKNLIYWFVLVSTMPLMFVCAVIAAPFPKGVNRVGKAWTARAFDVETKALAKLAQPGADFYGIHASNDGKVMIFAGGVPIKEGETVIGAVGVSGGTGKQDQRVVEAAAQALARG